MLTKSYELTEAQQKNLKIQAKWGSSLALMIWKVSRPRSKTGRQDLPVPSKPWRGRVPLSRGKTICKTLVGFWTFAHRKAMPKGK